jgi:hypothetical protein
MKEIEIRLFGAFRRYVPAGKISLRIDCPLTARQLKEKIQEALQSQVPGFSESSLIAESALATETAVLGEEDVVTDLHGLALLPPVCGG